MVCWLPPHGCQALGVHYHANMERASFSFPFDSQQAQPQNRTRLKMRITSLERRNHWHILAPVNLNDVIVFFSTSKHHAFYFSGGKMTVRSCTAKRHWLLISLKGFMNSLCFDHYQNGVKLCKRWVSLNPLNHKKQQQQPSTEGVPLQKSVPYSRITSNFLGGWEHCVSVCVLYK